MKSHGTLPLLLLVAACALGCTREEDSPPTSARPAAAEAAEVFAGADDSGSDCPFEQLAYVLDGTTWRERCYPKPIPRQHMRWAHQGATLIALGPTHCSDDHLPTKVWRATPDQVSALETDVLSTQLGIGGGVAQLGDWTVAVGGEACYGGGAGIAFGIDAQGKMDRKIHGFAASERIFWPTLVERQGDLLFPMWTSSRPGNLDLARAPGIQLDPTAGQCLFARTRDVEAHTEAFKTDNTCARGNDRDDRTPIFVGDPNRGRIPLTWVYDPDGDRVLFVGALRPDRDQYPLEDVEPMHWYADAAAWFIPAEGEQRALPEPPVFGDGVTLLRDPATDRIILLVPFAEQSYVLANDDSAWLPLKHEPLPVLDPARRESTQLTSTAGVLWVLTQWAWPYFAFWDPEADAPVVVPYETPDSLCLPLAGDGLEAGFACPKAHP